MKKGPAPLVFASPQEWLERYATPVTESGCWLWNGGLTGAGYAHLGLRRLPSKGHRASYHLFYGPIPPGLCVCHRCDVPSCVNPKHLFLGTKKDNAEDMTRKGRGPDRRRTHCKKGHQMEFSVGAGRNICKTCNRASGRIHDAKRYKSPARRDAMRKAVREHMARKRATRRHAVSGSLAL